jgi:hypothetical protein
LPENHDAFLRLLKNKGFKEERMTKVGLYAIGTSTTLESNKSHPALCCQWRQCMEYHGWAIHDGHADETFW